MTLLKSLLLVLVPTLLVAQARSDRTITLHKEPVVSLSLAMPPAYTTPSAEYSTMIGPQLHVVTVQPAVDSGGVNPRLVFLGGLAAGGVGFWLATRDWGWEHLKPTAPVLFHEAPVTATPEPSTVLLVASGLGVLAYVRRRIR